MNKYGQIRFTMRPKLESRKNALKEGRKNRRQIILEINDKLYADFLISLERDGINDMSNFIRALIILYIENNKSARPIIREIKKMLLGINRKNIIEERSEEQIDEELLEIENEKKKFGLSKEEVENIFDILEEDLPIF